MDVEDESRRLQASLSSVQNENRSISSTPVDANSSTALRDAPADSIEKPGVPSSVPPPSIELSLDRNAPESNQRRQSQIFPRPNLAAPNEQSSYYGRTSALFDDDSTDNRNPRSSLLSTVGGLSDKTQLLLMGEAARQRKS